MEAKSGTGLSTERLNRLAAAIRQDVEAGQYDGGVILVARHGVIGLQEAIGFAERASRRPCKLDDVFNILSITKAFTDVVLLRKIECGDLSLSTRVADVIPEFKGGFKEQVTIFHLLTHTAGAPPVFFPVEPHRVGNLRETFEASCQMGLISVPGEKVDYSPTWGHTLLAEMVRRVDGGKRNFRDILHDELFAPLKMKDTAMGRRRDLSPRVVPLIQCGSFEMLGSLPIEEYNQIISEDAEIPAWGAVSTVHDLFRFAEMLRRGGELDGVRILSPATIDVATTNHTGEKNNEGIFTLMAAHGWSRYPAYIGLDLGIHGTELNIPAAFGSMTSPRTFGKFGMGSTGFWVDPVRDVTFIFLSVGLIDDYANFFRFQRLSDMAMAAVI